MNWPKPDLRDPNLPKWNLPKLKWGGWGMEACSETAICTSLVARPRQLVRFRQHVAMGQKPNHTPSDILIPTKID